MKEHKKTYHILCQWAPFPVVCPCLLRGSAHHLAVPSCHVGHRCPIVLVVMCQLWLSSCHVGRCRPVVLVVGGDK